MNMKKANNSGPRILCLDIETSPILAYVWGTFDQNIGLDMIKDDWRIISFAAKWLDTNEVIQYDLRKGLTDVNEKAMLAQIWVLMDTADIIMGQNSKKFDVKKINERFLKHGFGPPSPFRQLDTLVISKKHFAPTSHKLEFRSKALNKKYKKMSHSKFPGFSLWKECLSNNQAAWKEMALYNRFDVLATEEYFNYIKKWDTSINYNVYSDTLVNKCSCGSSKLQKRGFNYTNGARLQRYVCTSCGAWSQGKANLLTKDKRKSLLK